MSHRRVTQYNHSDLYGNNKNEIDITEGNPINDPRVIQYKRQINQLKEKIELQTELNRQLERDKSDLQSQLESYKKRCVDLQKNLDDKDQHLNEVVATLTMQHSKPVAVKKKKERSGWFGFGTPKSNKLTSTPTSNIYSTPSHMQNASPISSPTIDINESYIDSPIDSHNNPITMTAPIGVLGSSLPSTINTRPRRHGSVHILDSNDQLNNNNIIIGTGHSNSLIGMDKNEMDFKIRNCSKDKLRNYIRDLFDGYSILNAEKQQIFQDLIKATHNQGWTEKEARNKEAVARSAIEKEKYAKNHIKMLEKSLNKERKKIEKYRISFEDFKLNAIKKRKELLLTERKLKDIISMKDEFIQSACYKLIVYKDRLAQFEIPVFQEYVILISPTIQELMRYDGEGMNGPGANNLNTLHYNMVNKQTPGGPSGPGYNDEINSAGGTVTSITSVTSNQSTGRRKSSSRKSSLASASNENDSNSLCDINDKSDVIHNNKKSNKKNKRKRNKVIRVKSYDDRQQCNDDSKSNDLINIPITAKSKTKTKKRKKKQRSNTESLSNLSKKIDRKKHFEEKKRKREEKARQKAINRKEKIKSKMEAATQEMDYLEMDLDDIVSSSSSSSSEENEFLLLSDSNENNINTINNPILEYALDENGKYIERTNDNNGISNNLSNYVELKLVKYPGTGELFVVLTKFDNKKDQMEIFRSDFAKCLNIEKNQIEEDFSMYFEHITLVFRGDDYEKVRNILINLRIFFEQHCTNIQPELPTPPEQTVTDQMNIFFGGGF